MAMSTSPFLNNLSSKTCYPERSEGSYKVVYK